MALLRKAPTREWEELKTKAANARLPFDKEVLLNLAFFRNRQYVEWEGSSNSIRTIARTPKEEKNKTPRPVANKIMHFVVKQHAAVLKDRPTMDVLPATENPIDISLAGVAKSYLDWLADPEVTDLDGEMSEAALWALAGGEAYLKWTYDPKEKRADIMACSPLEIYIDPYAKRWRNVRWAIHEQYMDIKTIKAMYGKDVPPTQVSKVDLEKAALLRDMGMSPVLEGAVVNELWLRPGQIDEYPRGLFCVWAGNEFLVDPRDYPYAHGLLPFTLIGPIKIPGSPHTTCTVSYLRSPQMELNKFHAQRIEVRRHFSNPKWWIPGELEMEAEPDDSPNQILRGNSGNGQYKPEIIQPTVFPDNVDGEWIVAEMENVAGQHEVSNGQVPGRVEAAQAIELLAATDDSHLSELRRSIKSALSAGGWQSLMLVKQYRDDEVVVQTYSKEGLPEVQRFMAAKLSAGMRVRTTMGTGLSNSRAARQQQAQELWREGIIRDPEVIAQIMDLPTSSLNPERMFDVRTARNENVLIAKGKGPDGKAGTAVKPNSWDNHEIHLREHNNYRKTTEYDELDNEAKQKFEFHCQTHEDLWLEELHKQSVRMMIAQGATGEPPAEPPGAAKNEKAQPGEPQAAQPEPQEPPTVPG